MPKIELQDIPVSTGSKYPAPYDAEMSGRSALRVGDAAGLTQFGVNITILEPGAKSSMRHWHQNEDEFVIVLDGEMTLVDDAGDTTLAVGDCAAFPAGDENGHHIVNRSPQQGRFLVVGHRSIHEIAHFSDVDMMVELKYGTAKFTRRNGAAI